MIKKLFLILFLLNFTPNAYATAIDVGTGAILGSSPLQGYTLADQGNPANDTGTIDYIEVYSASDGDNMQFGTCSASGNNLTTNGYTGDIAVPTGLQTLSAPTDFTAFDVSTGDYAIINCVYGGNSSKVRYSSSGGTGMWYVSGTDYIPCSSQSFSTLSGFKVSIYFEGETAGGGSAIKTINGLAKASVKTYNGLAIANVKSLNGLQ